MSRPCACTCSGRSGGCEASWRRTPRPMPRKSRGNVVSLLERLGRGHLGDRELAQLWTSGARHHPHLDGCASCQARFDAFSRWVAGIGDELRADADRALSSERLAAQQAQIARRLEGLERPARVIAFPRAARAVMSGHSHVRRWVTMAAAASLITGFGLGQIMPFRTALRQQASIAATPTLTKPATEKIARELTPPATSSPADDDLLLSDAFTRPRASTLSALDEMTPHARDAGK